MKNLFLSCIIFLLVYTALNISCQKFDPVAVTKFCKPLPVTNINYTSATVNGELMDIGDDITSYGHCWSKYHNPTIFGTTFEIIGTPGEKIEFISDLKGLSPSTEYFVRAFAKTKNDVFYGSEITFITYSLPAGKLVDCDNNLYDTVKIGSQIWMKQNLKVTHLNNGSEIPLVTQNSAWVALTTAGYCWYNNEPSNKDIYGALYNWYAVNTGKLCPTGWHAPSDVEWTSLVNYLGGTDVAGGKLREIGLTHWNNNNVGATNESGFTAVGAGHRDYGGTFNGNYLLSRFWTNTPADATNAYLYSLYSTGPQMARDQFIKNLGFSLRCIKD